MRIKTIAMIGAGNVGAYIVRGFAKKLQEGGIDGLWIIAEGARKERLEREGLVINGESYMLDVRTPEEAAGADLIIVGVKYQALREILPGVRTIAEPHTVVMSLMNGVDSEEILAEAVPKEQIVPANIKFVADRTGNAVMIQPTMPGMGIHYGAAKGMPGGEAGTDAAGGRASAEAILDALDELFDGADLEATREEDILATIWAKYAFNICENLPQAIVDVGVGCYEDSAHMAEIRTTLWNEVRMVAAAEGIDIPPETKHITSVQFPKQAIYSTLQDLRAGRQTEVEMFAGVLMRRAASHGLSVPCAETIYHLLCALEEKNDGKFEY